MARDLCACVFLRPRERRECSRLTRETARPREDKVGRKREQRRQALAKCGANLKVVPDPLWRAGSPLLGASWSSCRTPSCGRGLSDLLSAPPPARQGEPVLLCARHSCPRWTGSPRSCTAPTARVCWWAWWATPWSSPSGRRAPAPTVRSSRATTSHGRSRASSSLASAQRELLPDTKYDYLNSSTRRLL